MKKFTFQIFAILAFAFTWQANAQFTESFETEIPAAWTVINGGGSNAWVQSSSPNGGAQDGAGVASITYDSTAHNDYLITPSIVVTANTNDRLSFYVKSRSSSFLESYEVLLSTTDALEASFSTVLQASSEAPNAWTQLTFSLSAYVGQTIYVALRATGTDEFNLYADNFVNDAAPLCTPGLATATIVEDCVAETFVINVDVTTVGNATEISDGIATYPISGAGIIPVGPYAFGTSVTLDVVHDDAACDFTLGTYNFIVCPPANDECIDAETIACGDTVSGSTLSATNSGNNASNDVWYVLAGTANGETITASLCGSDYDTYLRIFDACAGTQVAFNDDNSAACGTGGNSQLTFTSDGATTYYIMVEGYQANNGNFDLAITCVPPPACLAPTIALANGANNCPTLEFFVDVTVSNLGTSASVNISDDGGVVQTAVGLGTYSVGPYAAGTLVNFTVEDSAGDTCNATGSITTPSACPPSNVDCANATPIACGETINATSVGSTGNQEGSGCSMGNNGIWFTFTGTGADITLASTASFDHEVALSSGSCGALVNVNCDDQSGGAESHTFTSVLNETYYVYIAHYSSGNTSTGTISITLTCAVIPTCTQAVVDSSTVVETCNPDGTGTFVVNHVVSNAGDAGTVLDDGTNTYPVIVGTITTGPYNSGDSVTIDLVGVDSDCDFTVGTYTFICPQPAPANDDIMNPVKIEMGSAVCEDPIIGTNVSATDSVENGASCGTPEGDVWFQIEIPNTGEVTVETSSSGGISDTVMAIYSGVPGSLVEVACDDDGGTSGFSSIALTGQTPGDIYYVRVWEYQNNAFGTFSICAWSPTTLSVDTNVIEGFSYYPNPVNNVLNVKAQTNISNVAVYNMLGQEVLRTAPNTFASEVDMSNLQTGAYFVKVTIGNATQTIRVIKN